MLFNVPPKVRRFITIFTIVFHIFIFSRIAIHYFDQKSKAKQREQVQSLAPENIIVP